MMWDIMGRNRTLFIVLLLTPGLIVRLEFDTLTKALGFSLNFDIWLF